MLAACLIFYNRFMRKISQSQHIQVPFKAPRQNYTPFSAVRDFFFKTLHQSPPAEEVVNPIPQLRSSSQKMRYPDNVRPTKRVNMAPASVPFKGPRTKQPYDVFLVLDIEGTCDLGTDFNYPNEIIVRPNDILEIHISL